MIRRIIVLLGAALIFVGTVLLIRQVGAPALSSSTKESTPTSTFELLTDEPEVSTSLAKQILLSSPLVIFGRGDSTPFTPAQVVAETNRQRLLNNQAALQENAELASAAEMKVRDMFEKQYFEHISPTGQGPDYLAAQVGYQYVSLGENLALGSFGDEAGLVDAWMQSPGHRANILRPQFQEIGVAVGRGMYQGKEVLIAVQEFGRPITSCPVVSATLKASIASDKASLATLGATLVKIKSEVDKMDANSNRDQQAYEDKIALYNSQVVSYNALVATIRKNTNTYNVEVKAFNACLGTSI